MAKTRGFEVVKDEHRKNFDKVEVRGEWKKYYDDIVLPTRADERSAGYDFYLPYTIIIPPRETVLIHTDVKSYMKSHEVLNIYIRSSLAIKKGLIIKNQVGVIDSSYYNNADNDGNIIIPLHNTTGQGVELNAGDRIAQGVFQAYLQADDDVTLDRERKGGIGSSGE